MREVRVLDGASVRTIAPARWTVGDGSEDGASLEGFVNGRCTHFVRHFRAQLESGSVAKS